MKTLYYPAWISPGRKAGGWSWGRPCDTLYLAAQAVKRAIADGASMGCVVELKGGEKTPLAGYIWPMSARKVVRHWEDLWDATETVATANGP